MLTATGTDMRKTNVIVRLTGRDRCCLDRLDAYEGPHTADIQIPPSEVASLIIGQTVGWLSEIMSSLNKKRGQLALRHPDGQLQDVNWTAMLKRAAEDHDGYETKIDLWAVPDLFLIRRMANEWRTRLKQLFWPDAIIRFSLRWRDLAWRLLLERQRYKDAPELGIGLFL